VINVVLPSFYKILMVPLPCTSSLVESPRFTFSFISSMSENKFFYRTCGCLLLSLKTTCHSTLLLHFELIAMSDHLESMLLQSLTVRLVHLACFCNPMHNVQISDSYSTGLLCLHDHIHICLDRDLYHDCYLSLDFGHC
jgi:hypothetical protein